MANYATLISAIQSVIAENGNNEITGPILQQTLVSIVGALGAGYQFVDVAEPSTNPGTPDQNVFYIAGTPGIYSNFGVELYENELGVFSYNGSWKIKKIVFQSKLTEIQQAQQYLGSTIRTSNGELADASSFVNEYDISDISLSYYASGRQPSNSTYCAIAYYSSNGTYLSAQKIGGDGVTVATDFVKFKLTIPTNAKTIRVVGNSNAQIPQLFTSALDLVIKDVEALQDKTEFYDEKLIELVTEQTIYADKTISKTNGALSDSTNSYVYEYANLDLRGVYYASGRQLTNTNYCSIAYYSGLGTFLGAQKIGGDGVSSATDFVKFKLTIPDGTATIRVVGNINAQMPELFTIANTEQIGRDVSELKVDVQQLQQTVGEIEENTITPIEYVAEYSGYGISKTDGSFLVAQNANVKEYPISDLSASYYASGRQLTNTNYCSIAYYTKNGSFIGSQKNGGDGVSSATDFVKFKLTIPAGTAIVRVYGSILAQMPELYADIRAKISGISDMLLPLKGKKVAIIGDSISTIQNGNTPYWTVLQVDVGHTIQSYVTWEDIYGNYRYPDTSHPTGKTIGGVLLTLSMVDGELHSFTPVAADVGKQIGVPHHYSGNTSQMQIWSQRLCDMMGAELLANASWSGSAITSMEVEGRGIDFTASQAWHPCTIGRCRVRDDAGNFVNPDVVIIYRGTNDFSYSNNGNYPTLQISPVDLLNGFNATTDLVGESTYNFRIGYYLTIKALRQAYPKAMIICATLNVFKRVTYNVWPTRNNLFTLPDINNAIREIANEMGCGLIEFDKDGITFENCYPTYISDSATIPTHPNNTGHRVMSEKAFSDIKYILNP